MKFRASLTALASVLLTLSCSKANAPGLSSTAAPPSSGVTPFLTDANARLLSLSNAANQAGWVQDTYITVDTQAISARAGEAYVNASTDYAKRAARFPAETGSAEERRQLTVLKNSLVMAGPPDPAQVTELSTIAARMAAEYGTGKYCPPGKTGDGCLDVEAVTKILAESRDPKVLRETWEGWQTVGVPMRKDFQRFVELSNAGARDVGFKDTGEMWKGRYDMPPEAFASELDRLWGPAAAALSVPSRACPRQAARPVRRSGAARRTDPGAATRQHLGSGLAKRLRRGGAGNRIARRAAHRHPGAAQDHAARDGAHRRALLHVARLGTAPRHVVGALAVRQAARSRGRLPRQ